MRLSMPQHDRSSGVLLGMACGDARGSRSGQAGSPGVLGQWSNHTALAIPVAQAVIRGYDLRAESTLDRIVAEWADAANTGPFAGLQLGAAPTGHDPTAAGARRAARARHDRVGRSAGTGCLLRTAPVALAYLHEPGALADAARALSELTHCDADAGDACVLWGLAIRHAVLAGELDLRVGLGALSPGRRELWSTRIVHAERRAPRDFPRTGWVVQALQGAWSAIAHTGRPDARQYRFGLEAAVPGGGDSAAVAGIAGALLAARWGLAAVPTEWRRSVQGRPGLRGADLVRLSVLATQARNGSTACGSAAAGQRILRTAAPG